MLSLNVAFSRPKGLLLLLVAAALVLIFLFNLDSPWTHRTAIASPSQDDHTRPPPSPGPDLLLVSAFFPLSNSKHTMSDYKKWLTRFLGSITTDLYFYAPPEMEELILACRGDLPMTLNTTFSSPFAIPPLSGSVKAEYEEMKKKDRELWRGHGPELYAIWHAKPYFLEEALKNVRSPLHKEYEYAFWSDAGSFRDAHAFEQWPDALRVREMFEEYPETIFMPIYTVPDVELKEWTEGDGPIENRPLAKHTCIEISEASFFGGTPEAITSFMQLWYAYHDAYLKQGFFVGKDQSLVNSLFFLFPERFTTIWAADPTAGVEGTYCGGGINWFYYQFFLASDWERERMRDMWDSQWKWPVDWRKPRCGVGKLESMDGFLKGQLGEDWQHPGRTIAS